MDDRMGMRERKLLWGRIERLQQALDEKDLQWKRRVGLDCGGHSCFYAIEKTGMRHNGPCSCNPKRTKEDYDRLYAAYQQLLEQAVRFARGYEECYCAEYKECYCAENVASKDVCLFHEAHAFLKEREGT